MKAVLNAQRLRRVCGISIGIPAYARRRELIDLLSSIYNQTLIPAEIRICEDDSPDRDGIRAIVEAWRERFDAIGSTVTYSENDHNLGYDANLRKVISSSRCPWVLLIGNDDVLLERGVELAERFILDNPETNVISRTFLRFERDVRMPIGISRISRKNELFSSENSSSRMIFRTSGFIGGLIVKRDWARSIETDRYDGTLFYQIYLSSVAFCGTGIGYIAQPTVGARSGNPPLFGSASSEMDVHVPGTYTPKGRAKMWASVLKIANDVGQAFDVELGPGIKRELTVRASFLLFEALAGSRRAILLEMRCELDKLDLFAHPIPRMLFMLDWALGSRARMFYSFARMVMQ